MRCSHRALTSFRPCELHRLAVVPDELRQNLGADYGHMAAGVAAEPDVITPDHGIAKGLRRPVAKLRRELGEGDVPFSAS